MKGIVQSLQNHQPTEVDRSHCSGYLDARRSAVVQFSVWTKIDRCKHHKTNLWALLKLGMALFFRKGTMGIWNFGARDKTSFSAIKTPLLSKSPFQKSRSFPFCLKIPLKHFTALKGKQKQPLDSQIAICILSSSSSYQQYPQEAKRKSPVGYS